MPVKQKEVPMVPPDVIKNVRLRNGLSQTLAGEMVYKNFTSWNRYENGRAYDVASIELFFLKVGAIEELKKYFRGTITQVTENLKLNRE